MKSSISLIVLVFTLALTTATSFGMHYKTWHRKPQHSKLDSLHHAALHGNEAHIATLIARGASVHARSADRSTPLMLAALRGHEKAVYTLIQAESCLEAQNDFGNTALHAAAKNNYVRVLQMLISWGANLNAQNNQGNTPLHLAAIYGNTAALFMLMEKGARIHIRNNKNELAEDIVINALTQPESNWSEKATREQPRFGQYTINKG